MHEMNSRFFLKMLQYPYVNDSVQMYTLYLTVADNTASKKTPKNPKLKSQ